MTTSGSNTGALRAYTARQILESALRRAGVKASQIVAETVEVAYDIFNVMLTEMPNLGMQLWARDQVIVPVYQNRNEAPLPMGTSVVFNVRQRTLMRPTPLAMISDQGGNADHAFDDDFSTACAQAFASGSLTAIYQQPTQISTVGILFADAQNLALFIEYDLLGDGNWVALDALDCQPQAMEWVWKDLQGMPHAIGWRIRSVGPTPMSVAELYFGNMPTEIPMGVWGQDDWDNMVVKNTPGAPWNWFQDRQLPTPVLYLWPMPDNTCRYMSLVCRRRRYLEQLTDMEQQLDISPRWYAAITASMARRCCMEIEGADLSRLPGLQTDETQALLLAQAEERDPAPMRYNPGLEVYRA